MNRRFTTKTLLLVAIGLPLIVSAGGCSGGGSGLPAGQPNALRVTATGQVNPLWTGTAVATPLCEGALGQNAQLFFDFAGAVSTASLPAAGPATGTINIMTVGGVPATGSFMVVDDPAQSAGNQRRVVFSPALPASVAEVGMVGYDGPATYIVTVPAAATEGVVLEVAGQPLANEIITCFTTCDPGATGCYTDPQAGSAFVMNTVPESGDPVPAPIDPAALPFGRFVVNLSEPVNPTNIDTDSVRLVAVATGAQVPGTVEFFQAGSSQASATTSRIDYVPFDTLLNGVTYELLIDPDVTDFGGNPVLLAPGPALLGTARRLFRTIDVPTCLQTPFVEDFTTTTNQAATSAVLLWPGNGELGIRSASDVFGDGSFGPLTLPSGPTTIDTGMAPTAGFENGTWNLTDLNVPAAAVVTTTGPFRIHFKCTGTAVVEGQLIGSAGMSPLAPPGSPTQGPHGGLFNNGGNPASSTVLGGVAGPGAGAGGRASQSGFSTRTLQGETGLGANGIDDPSLPASDFFGGGTGGAGGFRFPAGGVVGELGGIGAAGGSAWEAGQDGRPFSNSFQGCQPLIPAVQPISAASPIPPVHVAPIFVASGGSGGGGGGDRFEVAGPTSDDQGGGGGGGGGGIRISSMGDVEVRAGGTIRCDGANGGAGNTFFGGGGAGGSGGQIWLQSNAELMISGSAEMTVSSGSGSNLCTDAASGSGGVGLYQLEDGDGILNTSFLGGTTGGMNVITLPFPFGATVSGTATSTLFDTGYGNPDYDPTLIVETTDPGSIANAAVVVTWQGAHEAVSGGGVPDLATLSAPVASAAIDQLEGYRFLRFSLTLSYPGSPLPGPGAILPVATRLEAGFRAPVGCL